MLFLSTVEAIKSTISGLVSAGKSVICMENRSHIIRISFMFLQENLLPLLMDTVQFFSHFLHLLSSVRYQRLSSFVRNCNRRIIMPEGLQMVKRLRIFGNFFVV